MSVILITGSSTGIGQETALHMARNGHKVYASLRNPDGADELRGKIDAEGLDVEVVRLDVADAESIGAAVAGILARSGRIDAVVNNAGIGGGTTVEETQTDTAREVFETNYFGTVNVLRAVIPVMREQRSGSIVNITSMVAQIPMGGHGHYGASKLAVESLSEAMAQELAEFNVRVALVEPGTVLTPIWGKAVATDSGPYDNSRARLVDFFSTAYRSAAMPEAVAIAIAHAIEADTPRFRYIVGKDAEELIAARAKVSDEEWVRINCLPDAEFHDRMKQLTGTDYYPGSAANS